MAGLLDALNSDEGMQALGLLAAAGPSATPMSFGQRLFGAMQQDQARRTEAEDRKMRQQMQQLQMQQLLRQASRQKSMEDLPGQFMQPGMKPDTMDNRDVGQPGEAPIPKQQFDLGGYADALFRYDPHAALQLKASMQKDNSPIPVAKDTVLLDRNTRQPIFSNVQPPDPTSDSKNYQEAVKQGFKGSLLDYQTALKRAGATSVSVNTDNLGLKPKDRFEMEQKLAGDYTAATKLDRGIVTTAQDITNILKQGGALKDQAAIYKFAKALDPDGAVREADYAAIVQTAGGIGYVQALFNKALTGEQLLPRQRQEMINISQAMANVAQKRIENQRSSLSRNARQYNLTPENIFAPTETLSPTEGLGAVDLQAAAAAELKRRNGGR